MNKCIQSKINQNNFYNIKTFVVQNKNNRNTDNIKIRAASRTK